MKTEARAQVEVMEVVVKIPDMLWIYSLIAVQSELKEVERRKVDIPKSDSSGNVIYVIVRAE
jgi:hypothetical protein